MEGKFAEVEVRVHGKPVREFHHKGQVWIEGRRGSEFVLRVRNRTERRTLAVLSVDGLSVMDGKTASKDDSGYVIDPYSYVDIPGWRLDDDSVARFLFAMLQESYAVKMDKPQNVGVIGCAIFLEQPSPFSTVLRSCSFSSFPPSPPPGRVYSSCRGVASSSIDRSTLAGDNYYDGGSLDVESSSHASPAEHTPAASYFVGQEVGTGFGERTGHEVVITSFNKISDNPEEVLSIRYDSRQNLKKRGVPMGKRKHAIAEPPKPFPADEKGCKPPPGWRP